MSIGILSTGSEIVCGDIQNTTAQKIAKTLSDLGCFIGYHLSVSDDEEDMFNGLSFLFSAHDIVICTGGLGPTSDDRTRNVLARYFDEPLVFFENCWTHIVNRHTEIGLVTHDNNRQQALFPAKAKLFPNPHGTAFGCCFSKKGKTLYLLPGPPSECMPMFEDYVMASIQCLGVSTSKPIYRWLVFNRAESEFSFQVEKLFKNEPVDIGYRWHYPYIELKISPLDAKVTYESIEKKLKVLFDKELFAPQSQTALNELKANLFNLKEQLLIIDHATKGHLESKLTTPGLLNVVFAKICYGRYFIKIDGLNEFWHENTEQCTDLAITFHANGQESYEVYPVNLKRRSALKYSLELLAFKINSWLKSTHLI